jgi:hypothetical protein
MKINDFKQRCMFPFMIKRSRYDVKKGKTGKMVGISDTEGRKGWLNL